MAIERGVGQGRVAADLAGDLVAVHAGQADVEQDDVGAVGRGRPRSPSRPSWATRTSWPEAPSSRAMPRAVSTLSSTTRTRGPRPRRVAARPPRRPRRAGGGAVGRGEADGELAAPARALAPARRRRRRASRRACGPASGRSPGRPASGRSSCSTWVNSVEDPRAASRGRCPTPLSRDPDDDLAALAAGRQADPAAAVGVLGGVGQEVDEDLLQPGRVGLDRERAGADVDGQRVPPRVDQRPDRLDGPRDDRGRGRAAPCGAGSCPG